MEIKRSPMVMTGENADWSKGTSVVGARGFIFLSGSAGWNLEAGTIPETPREQAVLALENIKALAGEYGSSLENLVHIFMFVKGQFPDGIANDPNWIEIDKTMQEFWRENCPELCRDNNPVPETLVGVTSLAMPEFYIEIQATLAIP